MSANLILELLVIDRNGWVGADLGFRSHILIIGCVACFSLYFYVANQRQKRGKKVIEGTEGFRFTY